MRALAIGAAAGAVVVLTTRGQSATLVPLVLIPVVLLASYRGFREHVVAVVHRPARAKPPLG